jgi:hypothetical protein
MKFMPDWWTMGSTGEDNNGGFGTAAMLERMQSQIQPGEWDFLKKFKLADMLKGGMGGRNPGSMGQGRPMRGMRGIQVPEAQQVKREYSMPNLDQIPSFTPYQMPQVGPDMSNVQGAYGMQPGGKIFPNWNRR